VDFRILGPLEVSHEGELVRIEGARERALLVFLLLHRGEPVSVDRLVDELWGDSPPATARKSVQVRIAGLRRAVGDGVVVRRGDAYLIDLEPSRLDLSCFEDLLTQASRALGEGDPRKAVASVDEALSLWRGQPLAELAYESYAQPAIARLEELRTHALELRIEAQLELGRHADAIAALEELVPAHPFRERLRSQLMLALYREGRQAEALDVYSRARDELVESLGIEPAPALQRLQQAILRQDKSLDAPLPPPERSILVASQDTERLPGLLAIAGPLARQPSRELILARLLPPDADLASSAASLNEQRDAVAEGGVTARAITFTSAEPGSELVRIAAEQHVDLVLVDGSAGLDDPVVATLLARAACDVAVHVQRDEPPREGPVLVLFAGGDHDWTAVEIGAWLAGARGAPLKLAGPGAGAKRDASRTLASASLAVQRVFGVPAEPLLLDPAPRAVVEAAEEAGVVVVGLPDRPLRDGLGKVRGALATEARPPVLLVRRGLRPGGLAPRESLTRFTWTLGPAA
jgi:DNA-binding SARP family transcriptional activator/nucleotide-binding universal stress UspA family protein